jgi:hypothetical protein
MAHKVKAESISRKSSPKAATRRAEARFTVGLDAGVATQVVRYAETTDTSMSKALAALVRLGLEGQEMRKREFFKKLKANLTDDDPARQDEMVDEFRALILGR